jgi:hypothetical protein
MSKRAFFPQRLNDMERIQHRVPVLSLCRTNIETLTDPKTGAVAFFGNLCQESGRKRKDNDM